jgi:steroid delta-isomerase-like uncharacterized protein
MSHSLTPRQVATQWFQRIWNERDESTITEFMAPDAHGVHEGGIESKGPEDFKNFYRDLIRTFPDMSIELLDTVEEGEKVYVRWKAKGTHQGDAFGITATRQPHEFCGVSWLVVRDGKIIEGGDCWNLHGLISRMAAAAQLS